VNNACHLVRPRRNDEFTRWSPQQECGSREYVGKWYVGPSGYSKMG
jgi:hypothetical protein